MAQYAPLLANTHGKEVQTTTTSSEYSISSVTPLGVDFSETPQSGSKKKLKKRKKRRTNKPSKWADKCMYAELLEMMSDDPWSGGVPPHDGIVYNDGLPKDLETLGCNSARTRGEKMFGCNTSVGWCSWHRWVITLFWYLTTNLM